MPALKLPQVRGPVLRAAERLLEPARCLGSVKRAGVHSPNGAAAPCALCGPLVPPREAKFALLPSVGKEGLVGESRGTPGATMPPRPREVAPFCCIAATDAARICWWVRSGRPKRTPREMLGRLRSGRKICRNLGWLLHLGNVAGDDRCSP